MTAQRRKNAVQALQRLMDEPGEPGEMLLDLHVSVSPLPELARFLAGAPDYDDRAAALVYGAMVERALEAALSTHFVIDKSESSRIFSYSDTDQGRIAAFAAKAALGYALGIYDHRMRDDLTWIRRIRNTFAHTRIQIDFNTEEIRLACDQLRCLQQPQGRSKGLLSSPRRRYTAIAVLLTVFLQRGTLFRFDDPGILPLYEALYRNPQQA